MAAEKVLRWFVGRITELKDSEGGTREWLHVTVSQESKKGMPSNIKEAPGKMARDIHDDLSWWADDDQQQIDGSIFHEALLELVMSRNVSEQARGLSRDMAKRAPAEGMVFLQFIPKSTQGKLHDFWSQLERSEEIPDVEQLARLEGAQWCDFTRAARKMSGALYRQLLGEKEVGGNEAE